MSKIAIYFPGIGYHCDKPLLYYCREIACEMGYGNYRTLGYTYSGGNIRGNIEKMKEAYEALFAQTFEYVSDNAIGFIGTADPWSNIDEIINLAKTKEILLNVYDGCNHSLECDDTMKNLDILNDVMKKTKEYLV